MSALPLQWKNLSAEALGQGLTLRADWDRLNAGCGDLPFLSADATVAAWRAFGDGGERLLVAYRDGRAIAMLVVTRVDRLRWRTFQPSQIPLGVWVRSADLSPEPLGLSLMRSGALPLCLGFSFTQVDSLLAPPAADTPTSRNDPYIDTAWIDIVGSFDDYWAARGKNLRQNMRKQRNKLQAEVIQANMVVWSSSEDMVAAIARYGELEGRGWKAQQGTAISPDNKQGRFYTQLLTEAATRGEAVVYEYRFGDATVASNLCLRRGSTLVILKTTYDESIQVYSPAFLLHQDLIQSLFEGQGIRRVEYYGKVMEWHTRWTDDMRALYHLTIFRNGWLKRIADLLSRRSVKSEEFAAVAASAAGPATPST